MTTTSPTTTSAYTLRPTFGDDYIHCTTRTGTRVHLAPRGSSVTACGVWLRTSAGNYLTEQEITCEKCMAVDAGRRAAREVDR